VGDRPGGLPRRRWLPVATSAAVDSGIRNLDEEWRRFMPDGRGWAGNGEVAPHKAWAADQVDNSMMLCERPMDKRRQHSS
jgi:hypothetical protein